MSVIHSRQSLETIGRLGLEFLARIYPTLDPADRGKFVAVDTISEEYEVDRSELAAADRLHERCPGAEPFLGRYGYPEAHVLRSPR